MSPCRGSNAKPGAAAWNGRSQAPASREFKETNARSRRNARPRSPIGPRTIARTIAAPRRIVRDCPKENPTALVPPEVRRNAGGFKRFPGRRLRRISFRRHRPVEGHDRRERRHCNNYRFQFRRPLRRWGEPREFASAFRRESRSDLSGRNDVWSRPPKLRPLSAVATFFACDRKRKQKVRRPALFRRAA
jgi:hypothetical protein